MFEKKVAEQRGAAWPHEPYYEEVKILRGKIYNLSATLKQKDSILEEIKCDLKSKDLESQELKREVFRLRKNQQSILLEIDRVRQDRLVLQDKYKTDVEKWRIKTEQQSGIINQLTAEKEKSIEIREDLQFKINELAFKGQPVNEIDEGVSVLEGSDLSNTGFSGEHRRRNSLAVEIEECNQESSHIRTICMWCSKISIVNDNKPLKCD